MADERKRRRMESNRESARRSRVKKQQQLQQVISDIDRFKRQNSEMSSKIEETRRRCSAVETEIEIMAAQKAGLEQRLGELVSVIDRAEMDANRAADVGLLSVELPPIWRSGSWSEFLDNGGCGSGTSWMEGLGFDLDLSLSPWRSSPLMASAPATMSRT